MARAPGSDTAPTTGPRTTWRQGGRGTERGDGERGRHGVPSTDSTRRSQGRKQATGDGRRRAAAANGPPSGDTAAGNGRYERRGTSGDRGTPARLGDARRRADRARRRACGQACDRESSGPARWFTRQLVSTRELGATRGHDRRAERRGQRRQTTAFQERRGREVVRPAAPKDRRDVLRSANRKGRTREREVPGTVTWESPESATDAAFGQRPVS